MNQLPSAIIIARREQLRDSLQILLTSAPKIGSVILASDVSSESVEKETNSPAVALLALDSSYKDAETLLILDQIKSTWPGIRIAVLVENERQHRAAQIAGVDNVLFNGMLATEILRKIDELLP